MLTGFFVNPDSDGRFANISRVSYGGHLIKRRRRCFTSEAACAFPPAVGGRPPTPPPALQPLNPPSTVRRRPPAAQPVCTVFSVVSRVSRPWSAFESAINRQTFHTERERPSRSVCYLVILSELCGFVTRHALFLPLRHFIINYCF